MTAEFGDFANINVEKVVQQAEQQAARVTEIQEKLRTLVGRGQSEDGYVKAAYEASGGLTELELNPRAMRMASVDLAATIKEVIRAAADDLQRQIRQEMDAMFSGQENPREILDDPSKATARIEEIRSMLNGAIGDASAQMERMRKQLGL